MDIATVAYYAKNAQKVADRYEAIVSNLSENFEEAFRSNSRILDIGCGSGRDLALLAKMGHDPYGIDATFEFVEIAQRLHPELTGRIIQSTLPNFEPPFGGKFDGVLCSAVLMHLPLEELDAAATCIKQCLKQNGRLLYSVPSKRLEIGSEQRDPDGRLFNPDESDRLQLIFERLDFKFLSKWEDEDSLGRSHVAWKSVLMELEMA